MANQPKVRIVDDPTVLPIYADTYLTAMADAGTMSITLGQARFMPARIGEMPKPGEHPSVYVTARIVLSAKATVDLVNQLSSMLDTLGVQREAPKAAAEPSKPH